MDEIKLANVYTVVHTSGVSPEWDEQKNETNIKKHGVDFQDAIFFFENLIVVRIDNRKDYGEKRQIALGIINGIVLSVAFTLRNNKTRIISMRLANKNEREVYHEKIKSHQLG